MKEFHNNQVKKLCDILKQSYVLSLTEVEKIEYLPTNYRGNNPPPKDGFMPFDRKTVLTEYDKHYWFKFSIDFKKEDGKKYFLKVATGTEDRWAATNPQGLVFINGEIAQGIDTNHSEVLLTEEHNDIYVYHYTGTDISLTYFNAFLQVVDPIIESAYYDFTVPCEAMMCFNNEDERHVYTAKELVIATQMIDLREIYSPTFYDTLNKATEYLQQNLYGTKNCAMQNTVHCIGHTHIDVAWQWTLAQTREKAQRSFSTVLKLMEEFPEYLFMSSQPQLYEYVKQDAPQLYERIKKRVSDGRFEPEGAMWLEADCNLTSGESLVRQIVHGKRFFNKEFGVDNKVVWLPDVFGYSAAMPQILKKSGIDYFVTSKISWNDTNKMPYDTFYWEGIDGTEIFTNFITAQGSQPDGSTEQYTTYVGDICPTLSLGTWNRYQQKEYNTDTFITYGYGDGGGGPTRQMIEKQRRIAKGLPGIPKTRPNSAINVLKTIKENFDKNAELLKSRPKWVGELYLEYHRGTYTSLAKNKKNNRECEFLLATAEDVANSANRLVNTEYPENSLYGAWQTVLLNQFHDILPGSSIKEVYDDCDKDYADVRKIVDDVINGSLKVLAENVNACDGYLVYNPSGFCDSGIVNIDGTLYETPIVPSHGYTVFVPQQAEKCVTVTDNTAENDYYRLTVDNAGRITSLFDKINCREVFVPNTCGNELQIFEDRPHIYDNWELEPYYGKKMTVLDADAIVTPFCDNAGGGFRIEHKYMRSVIRQEIRLYNKCKRIDVINDIDWYNSCQLLKASFPLDVHTNKATFEIQFGNLERSTHRNTSWDEAKFEVCGQKYVDLSENGYGVSVLNNCKYGHSVEDSTLKLTLIKCTDYPAEHADYGNHKFTYSIYPHSGTFYESDTVKQAYLLNVPMYAKKVGNAKGNLPTEFSTVKGNAENVVIETVKKAYDGNGTVVRMYESMNKRTELTLTLGFNFKTAVLCDLLENPIQPLNIINNTVMLPVKNYEIVTVKFE